MNDYPSADDLEFALEPDPRTVLANERTFLAWIRTAVGFLAAGTALGAVPLETVQPELRLAAAYVLLAAGIVLPVQAGITWMQVERALRTGRPLPRPALLVPVTAALVAAGILLLLGVARG